MEEDTVNANDKESKEFEYFAAICENQLNTVSAAIMRFLGSKKSIAL